MLKRLGYSTLFFILAASAHVIKYFITEDPGWLYGCPEQAYGAFIGAYIGYDIGYSGKSFLKRLGYSILLGIAALVAPTILYMITKNPICSHASIIRAYGVFVGALYGSFIGRYPGKEK